MPQEDKLSAHLKKFIYARQIKAAVLSFAGVCALPWALPVSGEKLGYTNSIFSVFLFLALFLLFYKIIKEYEGDEAYKAYPARRWAGWFWPGCFGLGFSLCMVFGAQLDLQESIPFKSGGMWLGIFVLAFLFSLVARYSWEKLGAVKNAGQSVGEDAAIWQGTGNVAAQAQSAVGGKGQSGFWLTAGMIFLCYLPVFLAVYPGFFVYDAQDEYLQVVTRDFSTHHPLLHVLLLGGVIQLVYKLTGSYNLGIACYTLMQMAVMSLIFAWCIRQMGHRGMGKRARALAALYFGLFPVLVMFSLCSAKDGLFTGMLLVMVVLLQEMCADVEGFFKEKGRVFLFAASALGMMLLRHNGFYAFLVFIPILVFYLRKKCKRLIIYLALILLSYVLVDSGLTVLFHADTSENQEMLTVPISQMVRVYVKEGESLSYEDIEILYEFLPKEALGRYTPKVSDGVKIAFNNEKYSACKADFWRLWTKWGVEHPFAYLNAWFMTSYGFWYPDTVIDVYRGNSVFTFTYEDSSYFGYEVEEPGVRESKIPWLDKLYRKMSLEIAQQRIPVVSMLFSPGFLFWVSAFCLCFLCYTGRWVKALPFVLPFLCWLTVILGPTYLVRYVVFLWAELPFLLWECCPSRAGE